MEENLKNRSTDKLKTTTCKYSIKIASLFLSSLLLINSAPVISVAAEDLEGNVELVENIEIDEEETTEIDEVEENENTEINENINTNEESKNSSEEESIEEVPEISAFAATSAGDDDVAPQQTPEELGHYLILDTIYENASEITGVATPNALVLVLYPGTPQEISVNVNEDGSWILRNLDGNASTLTAGAMVPMTLVVEENGTRYEYDYQFEVQAGEDSGDVNPPVIDESDLFEPQTSSSLTIDLAQDSLPSNSTVITNLNDLPEGTTVEYINIDELRSMDPSTEGLLEVQVIYPDESVENLAMPVQITGKVEAPPQENTTNPTEPEEEESIPSQTEEGQTSSTDNDESNQSDNNESNQSDNNVGSSQTEHNTGSSQSNNREANEGLNNLNGSENIASTEPSDNRTDSETNEESPETLPETGESVNGSMLGVASVAAGLGLMFIGKKKETKET